ncbi:hypothetical protein E2C01_072038 [Portunus trituberculatus]|uniref:Secreted protein n=1 Tax=Portunus trituberculatus TaxID=210409 RepID=A0A5B7I1J9_PORTR|nr:hypothetical protein [Portunus trituberculatus]
MASSSSTIVGRRWLVWVAALLHYGQARHNEAENSTTLAFSSSRARVLFGVCWMTRVSPGASHHHAASIFHDALRHTTLPSDWRGMSQGAAEESLIQIYTPNIREKEERLLFTLTLSPPLRVTSRVCREDQTCERKKINQEVIKI